MAETIDVQARNDISSEMIRAKNAESKLDFAIKALQQELRELKESIDLSRDDAPTWHSDKLVSSGAVYDALYSLDRKIDALRQ